MSTLWLPLIHADDSVGGLSQLVSAICYCVHVYVCVCVLCVEGVRRKGAEVRCTVAWVVGVPDTHIHKHTSIRICVCVCVCTRHHYTQWHRHTTPAKQMHDVRPHSKKQRPFYRHQMDTLHLSCAALLSPHVTLTCGGSYVKATCNRKTTVLFIAALSPERLLRPATISCMRWQLGAVVYLWTWLCIQRWNTPYKS